MLVVDDVRMLKRSIRPKNLIEVCYNAQKYVDRRGVQILINGMDIGDFYWDFVTDKSTMQQSIGRKTKLDRAHLVLMVFDEPYRTMYALCNE